VGASLLAIAALIEAGGQPKPCRGQGRSHRKRARPAVEVESLWEGSSDPESDGGQCAALDSGPFGGHGYLSQSALARFLERSLWERACSRLRP